MVGSNIANRLDELKKIDAGLLPLIERLDGTEELISALRRKHPLAQGKGGGSRRAWDLSGIILHSLGRVHEALAVQHWEHYRYLLEGQHGTSRIHKGTPLVRIK
jgi:hypothetical protein